MIPSRYRISILAILLAILSACTSPHALRREGEAGAMQAFAKAYEQEQTAYLLRTVDGCDVDYPEVVMLYVPGGLRGHVYMHEHEIPVFADRATLSNGCAR